MSHQRRASAGRSRQPRLLLGISVLILILLCFLGGGLFFITSIRPDIGYGLQDTLFRKREPLAMDEIAVSESDTESVSLHDIREGKREDILYQNSLWLINAEYPLAEDAALMLTEYKDTGLLIDSSAVQSLQELLAAAEAQTGDRVYLMSTYRSWQEQEQEYQSDPKLAVPAGTSEHQTGLAIDLYVYQKAQREFITAKAGVWIQEHAHEYGFLIRYPFGKQAVTGVSYEPWHIRYVGKPHAALMYANRWTLEEYVEQLEAGRFYTCQGYGFSRQEAQDGRLQLPQGWKNVTVSADNTGAYILTGEI